MGGTLWGESAHVGAVTIGTTGLEDILLRPPVP